MARLAGIPEAVIDRAREVLDNLEKGELDLWGVPPLARSARRPGDNASAQMEIFPRLNGVLEERLKNLSLDHVTPFQALVTLKELKDLIEEK